MLLEIDGVTVAFGGITAVKQVSFGVGAGQIVSVIGPNGAGKTTLFNVITGFTRPTRGTVRFAEGIVTGLAPHRIAHRGLVRTFQKTEVFPELRVFDCVRIGLLNRSAPSLAAVLFGGRSAATLVAQAPDRVREILATVGLRGKSGQAARELSYGEQRLLEVAVGLAAQPRLLLLDEPASGLNPEEADRMGVLIRLLRERGISVLLVEHNMGLVMEVSDSVVVLHHGEKIAEGTPRQISADRAVIAAYLGQAWGDDAAADGVADARH